MGVKTYAVYDFPLGKLKISCAEDAVTSVKPAGDEDGKGSPSDLSDEAAKQLSEYFSGKLKAFDLPLKVDGTPFQKRVWAALREIPYGETRSYKEIAKAIGNPKACRAVGMANNKNPLTIIIPCHRVVGANGALVGFGGGLDMKKWLLELESGVI